ncbi:Transposase IS116/IS110/IS902 family protein, partial [Quadrisphaera granulorum]
YRGRHTSSGAKSDTGDAAVLAEIVRVDRAHHRPVAGDSAQAEGIKLVARAHQSAIWARVRTRQRLVAALKEYFPGALAAFAAAGVDLTDADALELLERAADPDAAAALTRSQVSKALQRARRRDVEGKVEKIRAVLAAPALRQPAEVQKAYAAITRSQVRLLRSMNEEIEALGQVVADSFGAHPDAEIYLSVPGIGTIIGARTLGEFGDDPTRYASAKARKNYAGTSPITVASGRKSAVLARYARNKRLGDATHTWAFAALSGSPGARAYYDELRQRGKSHEAALRQLANRLVGILHGCLRHRVLYDEATAWPALAPVQTAEPAAPNSASAAAVTAAA